MTFAVAADPPRIRCGIGKSINGDLCFGCQLILKQGRVLELERQYIVDTHFLRQEVERLKGIAEKARAWLEADDAFYAHMEKADLSNWNPNYGDESWAKFEACREALRQALAEDAKP